MSLMTSGASGVFRKVGMRPGQISRIGRIESINAVNTIFTKPERRNYCDHKSSYQ
jgi:hypothetical protein